MTRQGRLQRRKAEMRDDLTAKGRNAVGKIAEEGEPEKEVALWIEECFPNLGPLHRIVVDSRIVVAHHLNRRHVFIVTEELGAALRCREEDVNDNRP